MFRNRDGVRVEPAPFVVMVGTAALVVWPFGPPYFLAWGASMPTAVGATAVVFGGVVAWAYYQCVWTARPPEETAEVPAEWRVERFLIGGVAVAVVLAALTALLYLR
ncbi:hypothetical protein GCM10009039_02720 [Halocalculus aciditolerans]|uniref:Uncharacterized protein n=1 Tax=Halocalculus aciditolerans TaxID=1383812 RepID=A0A830F257_9EURY|nr:hypothetical protein GCM10009039_02720 [Halocalculus aciditolerans]